MEIIPTLHDFSDCYNRYGHCIYGNFLSRIMPKEKMLQLYKIVISPKVLKSLLYSPCFVSDSLGHSAVGFWWKVMKENALLSLRNGKSDWELKVDCKYEKFQRFESPTLSAAIT